MNALHGLDTLRRGHPRRTLCGGCHGPAPGEVRRQGPGRRPASLRLDTLSTHALMRGAVIQLNRWGLTPEVVAAGTPAIRSATFHYGDEAVRVDKSRDMASICLLAPRRTCSIPCWSMRPARLARRFARRLPFGVQFAASGDRVIGASLRDAGGACKTVHSDIVIGADGRHRQSHSSSMPKCAAKASMPRALCSATLKA